MNLAHSFKVYILNIEEEHQNYNSLHELSFEIGKVIGIGMGNAAQLDCRISLRVLAIVISNAAQNKIASGEINSLWRMISLLGKKLIRSVVWIQSLRNSEWKKNANESTFKSEFRSGITSGLKSKYFFASVFEHKDSRVYSISGLRSGFKNRAFNQASNRYVYRTAPPKGLFRSRSANRSLFQNAPS